jgi:voltage-gated potassium channel
MLLQTMRRNRGLLTIAMLPPGLVLIGTAGYHFIEGWPYFDALYMSVITLTTVGFAEVRPLSIGGRIFTMAFSLIGIFTAFFAGGEIVRRWASGELRVLLGRQRWDKTMSSLSDHVVVCGYGRMGKVVCQEFERLAMPFIVIDSNAEALTEFSLKHGIPLHGNATDDETLKKAGIERARSLVTVVASDAENLFITMSARLLNEGISIIARSEEDTTAAKLIRAGATRVISPYVLSGSRVAQAVVRPTVLDFIDLATRREHIALQLEEVVITPKSNLAGTTVGTSRIRPNHNVIVVAIKRKSASATTFNPSDDESLSAGDTLVLLGARDQLDRVEQMAGGRT